MGETKQKELIIFILNAGLKYIVIIYRMESGSIELEKSDLSVIGKILAQKDHRCVYMVDKTGNAETFFKYKGKMMCMEDLYLKVQTGSLSKEEAVEKVRQTFLFGMKGGEATVLNLGTNSFDIQELLKGHKFWNPKELFKSPKSLSQDWFLKNVSHEGDTDSFGNKGPLYPSDDYTLFVLVNKEVPFQDIQWLQGTEKEFHGVIIQ